MAIDVDGVPEYTDEQQLIMWKAASIALATSKEYTMGGRNGRTLTRADAKEVREMIEFFEGRIDTAANPEDANGGLVLVRWGERV